MIRTDATARRAAKHERYLREIREHRSSNSIPADVCAFYKELSASGWVGEMRRMMRETGLDKTARYPWQMGPIDDAKIVEMIAATIEGGLSAHSCLSDSGDTWGVFYGVDEHGRDMWEGTIDYDVLARAVLDKLKAEGVVR